jgi:dTDP-4-amino-4,6-dideoxygalactose transaminase
LPAKRSEVTHVYHLYVVRCKERNKLQAYLKDRGIGALVHYPVPVHQQPAYLAGWQPGQFPKTEVAAHEILSLPMYPELSNTELQTVIQSICSFEGG